MQQLLHLTLSLLLLLLLPTASPSGDLEPSKPLIFILAGQSNMAGRGGVSHGVWDHKIPLECRPSPSILRLNARLQWEIAADPLHADIDLHMFCGVGPGMPFANALIGSAADPDRRLVVGLVPCAMDGTKISEWERGQKLYDEMIKRAKAAVGGGGRIEAVLWYQGESDTVSREDAEAYQGRMERLVRDLRSDLGDPQLLIIQVALASGDGPYIEIVRNAQIEMNNISNVEHVDAKGLQLQEDQLHLTTEAEVQLGKMLADSYINHLEYNHYLATH